MAEKKTEKESQPFNGIAEFLEKNPLVADNLQDILSHFENYTANNSYEFFQELLLKFGKIWLDIKVPLEITQQHYVDLTSDLNIKIKQAFQENIEKYTNTDTPDLKNKLKQNSEALSLILSCLDDFIFFLSEEAISHSASTETFSSTSSSSLTRGSSLDEKPAETNVSVTHSVLANKPDWKKWQKLKDFPLEQQSPTTSIFDSYLQNNQLGWTDDSSSSTSKTYVNYSDSDLENFVNIINAAEEFEKILTDQKKTNPTLPSLMESTPENPKDYKQTITASSFEKFKHFLQLCALANLTSKKIDDYFLTSSLAKDISEIQGEIRLRLDNFKDDQATIKLRASIEYTLAIFHSLAFVKKEDVLPKEPVAIQLPEFKADFKTLFATGDHAKEQKIPFSAHKTAIDKSPPLEEKEKASQNTTTVKKPFNDLAHPAELKALQAILAADIPSDQITKEGVTAKYMVFLTLCKDAKLLNILPKTNLENRDAIENFLQKLYRLELSIQANISLLSRRFGESDENRKFYKALEEKIKTFFSSCIQYLNYLKYSTDTQEKKEQKFNTRDILQSLSSSTLPLSEEIAAASEQRNIDQLNDLLFKAAAKKELPLVNQSLSALQKINNPIKTAPEEAAAAMNILLREAIIMENTRQIAQILNAMRKMKISCEKSTKELAEELNNNQGRNTTRKIAGMINPWIPEGDNQKDKEEESLMSNVSPFTA